MELKWVSLHHALVGTLLDISGGKPTQSFFTAGNGSGAYRIAEAFLVPT